MKNIKFLTVLFLVALINSAAVAQRGEAQKLTRDNYEAFSESQATYLRDSLHLSPSQTAQIKKIFMAISSGVVAINDGNKISITDRRSRVKNLDDTKEAALKETLTPEQYEQYRALVKRVRDRAQALREAARKGK